MNDMQSLSYARWGCQHQVTKKGLTPYIHKVLALIVFGAGGRNRTDMSLRSRDFEYVVPMRHLFGSWLFFR